MSNRVSVVTGGLLLVAWFLGVLGLMHNEKVAKKKPNMKRGKGGANEATFIFGPNEIYGRCFICNGTYKLTELVVMHYLGDKECSKDHVAICANCEIPEGWHGCGCGG